MDKTTARLKTIVVVITALATSTASADTFIDSVFVGNAGNPGELSGSGAGGYGEDRICGAVEYEYRIGTYEVTNAQYTAFLNATATTNDTYGLWNASMGDADQLGGITRSGSPGSYSYLPIDGRANVPVNWVSFWDACRFANWMHNGQPEGIQDETTTEDGAYSLEGYTGSEGSWITRNPEAVTFVPSEDEWYKAAYHKNDGISGNYWDYPVQSDTIPSAEAPPGTDLTYGSANYNWALTDFTPVGSYTAKPSDGPYGTMDQAGNAWEWNEGMFSVYRGLRGGCFKEDHGDDLAAHTRNNGGIPSGMGNDIGFRLAFIPEPATLTLCAASAMILAEIRNRRRR